MATLPVVISDTEAVYLYGLDIIAQQQTERLYYVHDGLGSVRQLLDTTGQIETNYAYDPFGVPLVGGEVYNPYQYTGEAWDAEVELLYLRARYYQPEVGRFITKDPWKGERWLPASLNPYPYAHNNPTDLVDHGGLFAEPPAEPHIVSRSEWGAMDPGVYQIKVRDNRITGCDVRITTGRYEGIFDPIDPQATPGGYVRYEDLFAACKSGGLSDPVCDRLPPGETFDLAVILDTVVIHHEGNIQTYDVQVVQRKHMIEEGYSDVGYHYMVGPNGSIYEGRSLEVRGAHVVLQNTGMVGVLELGDFQPGMVFSWGSIPFDWNDDPGPTAQQFESTVTLIRWLDYLYGIDRVMGHRDVPGQGYEVCPGKNFTQSQIDQLNAVAQER
jgi:RHS repeat-associated protein